MAWISSSGVTVDIGPFLKSGYKFRKLQLTESLGGIIASGGASLYCDGSNEALELITKTFNITITLKKKVGVSYNIPAFITTKKFIKNILDIEFLCLPDKTFFSESEVLEWPDITTALESLWPGKKDFRCESDINNEIKLFQTGENNYSICKRLAYSFKQKSIFAFGLEGFLIKDLVGIDSTGQNEPYWTIMGEEDVFQKSPYNLNYNYRLYKENINPWEENYSDKESKNISVQILDNSYRIVHKDYYQLLDNYVYNTNLMSSKLYNSFTVVHPTTLPEFKIGDVIKYRRAGESSWMPITTFLVSQMDIFIATEKDKDENGLGFSVTSVLRGIEENGSVMPDTDPSDAG